MDCISRERIFKECVMNEHCLMLRLKHPVSWGNHLTKLLYVKDMRLNPTEKQEMLINYSKGRNTYGRVSVDAFFDADYPNDLMTIDLSTSDISSFSHL